ncbi:MAG: metal ABC transporter substrate-binding protein [Dehalococcoidia bacterium]
MVRRLLLLVTSALLISGSGAACGDSAGGPGAFGVVATMSPVGALVQAVAGGAIDVVILAGPGIDPHEYELTARDRRAIEQAKLVFRGGLGIDDFLNQAIDAGSAKVTTLTDGLRPEEGGAPIKDPHVWHNPRYDQYMVARIGEALATADPANGDGYRQRARDYVTRLAAVDEEVKAILAAIPAENRKLVTNHDGFGYFIEHYNLTFVGAVIPAQTTQAEPSAKDLRNLVELIKQEDVKAIFAESSIDPRVARQIASDTGVKIIDNLYVDTLGPPGSGAETIDGMLLTNARTIAEALK